MIRTFRIYYLNNFPVYQTAVLMIVRRRIFFLRLQKPAVPKQRETDG